MGNLEAHWLALSNLVPDNRPLEYSTGKIQTFISCLRVNVLLLEHHFRSSICDCSCIVQLMVFIGIWFIGIVSGSQSHGDFLMALFSMGFHWAFQPPTHNPWISITRPWLHRCQLILGKHYHSLLSKVIQLSMLSARIVISLIPPNLHLETGLPNTQVIVCTNPLQSQMCVGSQSDPHKPQPIKPFVFYSFHDYLAMLLSHKDLKGLMDKACDDLHSTSSEPLPEFALDIWDAEFLRKVEGPENNGLFVARRNEGRYLFTFNYDTFNIEGMWICGTTTSCGYYPWFALIFPQISATSLRICMLLVLSPVHIYPKKCSSIIIFNLSSMTWKFHGAEE